MPLSLEAIRNLNKMKFIVECCKDPAGAPENNGGSTWAFELYSDGGIQFGAQIQNEDLLTGFLSNNRFASLVKRGVQIFTGVLPQIDISRKYLYGGSNPISFPLKTYLVLETDPQEDFINPLIRLFYLTYPHRTG